VRLAAIQPGDIVEVDRLGRRFHALVTGEAPGGLAVQPLDKRVTYRSCRAHEVRTHWSKRGRLRATDEPPVSDERPVSDEPLEPSPLQMELDITVRG
jgi:hypothetical protein